MQKIKGASRKSLKPACSQEGKEYDMAESVAVCIHHTLVAVGNQLCYPRKRGKEYGAERV